MDPVCQPLCRFHQDRPQKGDFHAWAQAVRPADDGYPIILAFIGMEYQPALLALFMTTRVNGHSGFSSFSRIFAPASSRAPDCGSSPLLPPATHFCPHLPVRSRRRYCGVPWQPYLPAILSLVQRSWVHLITESLSFHRKTFRPGYPAPALSPAPVIFFL